MLGIGLDFLFHW